nr:MAG TPA: 60S ribosomal protein L11 [Caudoviricetes sp.]
MSRYECMRCWTHRVELSDHPPPGKEALSGT